MNKIKCYAIAFCRIAAVSGMAFATWKLVRHWHAGLAEKTGHTIDASIRAGAEKLENTAIALENGAELGMGEYLGKGLDGLLMDTKNTLDKATDLVQRALHHAK